MTFPPFSEPQVKDDRERMPSDHPAATHPAHVEGVTPAQAAAALHATGLRGMAEMMTDRTFAIALARALPVGTRIGEGLDLPGALAEVRAELRRLVEAGTAARLDPEHEAAVRAESANCCRPVRRRTESEGA